MLFGMVERGMGGTVLGDKGKLRNNPNTSAEGLSNTGDEAMWAVVLTKELWKKGIWFVSLAPFLLTTIDASVGTMLNLLPLLRWDVFILSPKSRVHLYTSSSAVTRGLRTIKTRATTT